MGKSFAQCNFHFLALACVTLQSAALIGSVFLSGCSECEKGSERKDGTAECTTVAGAPSTTPQVSILASGISASGYGLTVDSGGNVFFLDYNNGVIRKLSSSGTQTVFYSGTVGYFLAIGANDYIFMIGIGFIKKISPAGSVLSTITTDASLYPTGFTVDSSGNLYFTSTTGGWSTSTNVITKVTSGGAISTFAGSGVSGSTNGNGTSASFDNPQGIVADSSGNVYVVDAGNSKIRKITPSGDVTTLSGTGTRGTQNGSATEATFNFRAPGAQPNGIGISTQNVLYVGQAYGLGILRAVTSDGTVTTYCGNGTDAAVAGACDKSGFYSSGSVAIGPNGSIYVNGANSDIVKIAK